MTNINDLKINDIYNLYNENMETVFTETYNEKAVHYLLKMTPADLKEEFFKDIDTDKEGKKYDFAIMSKKVRELCRLAITNDFAIKQKYKFASFMKEGRLYVKGNGLQQLSGELRKLLNGDKCYDLDIENAHFRLMYNEVIKYNKENVHNPLACKYLREYINNREKVFKDTNTNKKEFIMMLYNDKIKTNKKDKVGYYSPNPFCSQFHNEKQIIFNTFYQLYKDKYKHWNDGNKDNPISSWFNKYISIFENIEVQKAIQYIKTETETLVEFPMYDGLCVSRKNVDDVKDIVDNLNKITDGIKWTEKYNISNYVFDEDIDASISHDYTVRKGTFEETRAMINNPFIFIQQIKDKNGKLEDILYNESEFSKKHRNYRVLKKYPSEKDPDPMESITRQWFEDPAIRQFNGLDFLPYSNINIDQRHQDDFYNMFRPFNVQIVKTPEKPEWFLDYIYNGLGDGNKEKGDWLLKWFTHIIKHPSINQEVCLVLRGNQGTGKDTITYILGKIFGDSNNYIHRTSDMYEAFPEKAGFNSCLKNKLILQFNEVDGADTAKVKNKMKDAITRKENMINEKYIKEFTQTNYVQCIICSNSKSPVQIEWGDRRMCVMKTADYHTGQEGKEWWSDLYGNYINNPTKINELYSWLINEVDVSEFNAARDRVKTSEYNRLAESQIPPNVLYLKHLAENDFNGWSKWTDKKTDTEYVFTQSRSYVDTGRDWIREYLKIDYNIKSSEFQRDLQEFEGVDYNKSVKIKGKSRRYIWIEKEKFINDITVKYKTQNDDEEFEIELDPDCLIEFSDDESDTDDLDKY